MNNIESGYMPEQDMLVQERVVYFRDGIGPVKPTGEISDGELYSAAKEAQKPIEDVAKVCIDEREAVEGQPVREKMAGGNVTTAFVAAELAEWALFTDEERQGPVEKRVNAVADHLVAAGEKLGAHIDNHADESSRKCNCGAADGCPGHMSVVAQHGLDIEFVAQMKAVLGELYSEHLHMKNIAVAAQKTASNEFASWTGWYIINAVKRHEGVVEVLNGNNERPDQDPENLRHNHWAEGVSINFEKGKSNDRDSDGTRIFQVDVPAIIETCQRMASTEEEFLRLLHAATAFQLGVRYNLTSGQPDVLLQES